jgi:hypothetical protein
MAEILSVFLPRTHAGSHHGVTALAGGQRERYGKMEKEVGELGRI